MVTGESVILRQSNYAGIIAFIGETEFASGLWIGVERDAPLGKYTGPRTFKTIVEHFSLNFDQR